MWLLNIVAFLIISIFIALKTKENMAEVFPLTTCGLIFALYIMAYFRSLSAIDFFCIGIILYSAFIIAKADKVKRGEFVTEVKDLLFHPVTIMILVVVIAVSFLVQGRIALCLRHSIAPPLRYTAYVPCHGQRSQSRFPAGTYIRIGFYHVSFGF